jgi:hypothetical protein
LIAACRVRIAYHHRHPTAEYLEELLDPIFVLILISSSLRDPNRGGWWDESRRRGLCWAVARQSCGGAESQSNQLELIWRNGDSKLQVAEL